MYVTVLFDTASVCRLFRKSKLFTKDEEKSKSDGDRRRRANSITVATSSTSVSALDNYDSVGPRNGHVGSTSVRLLPVADDEDLARVLGTQLFSKETQELYSVTRVLLVEGDAKKSKFAAARAAVSEAEVSCTS
jgi:hypothetical protein